MKKTYVITGTTSGIGKTLLEAFAKENIVFAGYRNENYLESLKSFSDNVIPFFIDMESRNSIAQAAAFIKSKTDKIDTIINVAGCVIAGLIERIDIDDLRKQFEVNTFSHLDLTQRLLLLLKKDGKIINISSMASFGIFPFVAPYCASKRALDILFNSLAVESNIKVVSVKPGVIATPLWGKSVELNKNSIEKCKEYEKEMQYMIANAKKNETNGLDVHKVTDLIVKIDGMENPKSSYTVGKDAFFAKFISKLPQDWLNKMIRYGIKAKVSSLK